MAKQDLKSYGIFATLAMPSRRGTYANITKVIVHCGHKTVAHASGNSHSPCIAMSKITTA